MPAAQNTPGFVSFNDYLDANAGSLAAERGKLLQGADAVGAQAQNDLSAWTGGAYNEGQNEAKAAWAAQLGPDPKHPDVTNSDQYVAPTYSHTGDPTANSPGYDKFMADRQTAQDALSGLGAGGLGTGYGALDASMIGASSGYQGQVKALGDKYSGALNDYLGQFNKAGQAGVDSFHPDPVTSTETIDNPNEAGTGDPTSANGSRDPFEKPRPVTVTSVDDKPTNRRRGYEAP